MKFRCGQCGAQYMIADEKVGKVGVKVRCKKCSHIITVRPSDADNEQVPETGFESDKPEGMDGSRADEQSGVSPEHQAVVGQSQEGLDMDDDELGEALDNLLGIEGETQAGTADGEDYDHQETRVFNVAEMEKVQQERQMASQEQEQVSMDQPPGNHAQPTSSVGQLGVNLSDQDRKRVEWYAAVEEQQIGPISMVEMVDRWEQGEFDTETLVWKSGFADWVPIFDVDELRFLIGGQADRPSESHAQVGDEQPESSSGWSADGQIGDLEDPDSGEPEQPEGWYDSDDASATDSPQAFSDTEVDWRPSAISSLSKLAEEELASLKPSAESTDESSSVEQPGREEQADEELEAGGSSIIGQIAAEEEAAARWAQKARLEKERRAEAARQEKEKQALEAQTAVGREQDQQRFEKVHLDPESVVPVRSGLPRWAITAIIGCIVVILGLSMFIVYRLGVESSLDASDEMQSTARSTKVAAPSVLTDKPVPPTADPPRSEEPNEQKQTRKDSASPAVATVSSQNKPEKKATGSRPAGQTATSKRRKAIPAREKPTKKKTSVKSAELARRYQKSESPPSRQKVERKSARSGSSSSILDFEDEKAFADVTGERTAVRQTAPKPVKKQLPPLSQADIMDVMRGRLAEFKACTRLQKQRDASVRGKMVVTFVIQPSGRVSKATISTQHFKNTFFAECVSKIVRQLKFPEFGGKPKQVPFPFTIK